MGRPVTTSSGGMRYAERHQSLGGTTGDIDNWKFQPHQRFPAQGKLASHKQRDPWRCAGVDDWNAKKRLRVNSPSIILLDWCLGILLTE